MYSLFGGKNIIELHKKVFISHYLILGILRRICIEISVIIRRILVYYLSFFHEKKRFVKAIRKPSLNLRENDNNVTKFIVKMLYV